MADNFTGAQVPASNNSELNALTFLIKQVLASVAGAAPVKVVSVTNSGGISPVGFVDVLPLVNQIDGKGKPVPHGIVHHLPYFRVQGGANAIIIDPQVGDLGLAVFADRDVSAVKNARGQANPGSRRQNDWADGFYFGGFLNAAPTQYIAFTPSGITIVSPTQVTIQAPQITLNGQLTQTALGGGSGSVSLQGPVTVTNDLTAEGTSVHTHRHTDVQPGASLSGPPA